MKFSAAAFLALLSSVKGDNYEYRGHNVATEVSSNFDNNMKSCVIIRRPILNENFL